MYVDVDFFLRKLVSLHTLTDAIKIDKEGEFPDFKDII